MSAFLWNRSVNLLDPRPRRRDFLAEANPPDEKEETENAIRLNQNLVMHQENASEREEFGNPVKRTDRVRCRISSCVTEVWSD